MKKSEELLELAIISIEDGREIGRVCDLIINPAQGAVEYLIVENGSRYIGVKVLPFDMIEGVGAYAVTIANVSALTDLADRPEVNELLEKNVRVKGTKVLTKKGKLIGTVSEFLVDDENEGKIAGCEVAPVNGAAGAGAIPAEQIITFGKDVLIITTDTETAAETTREPDAGQDLPSKPELSQAARLFEERQRQYLLGRKIGKHIETDGGEVLAEEGDVITEELLDKAKEAGKFTEISMNTKA